MLPGRLPARSWLGDTDHTGYDFPSEAMPLYLLTMFAKNARANLSRPAARSGVSVATLRHWERGDRSPQGPALVLLNLIDRDPAAVLRALS